MGCSGTCGSDGTCTAVPTLSPSNEPTLEPSQNPTTYSPTTSPSGSPSMGPSQRPLEATTLRTLVCGAKDNCLANQKTAEKTPCRRFVAAEMNYMEALAAGSSNAS